MRNKFQQTIDENLLEDIIDYLKEAKYIDDIEYIEKTVNNFKILKNLSIREVEYKLMSKGLKRSVIEEYLYNNRDELEEYEIKSASNIIYKKSSSMQQEDIKQSLLKKGYKIESINKALEQ